MRATLTCMDHATDSLDVVGIRDITVTTYDTHNMNYVRMKIFALNLYRSEHI